MRILHTEYMQLDIIGACPTTIRALAWQLQDSVTPSWVSPGQTSLLLERSDGMML